jgi:lipid-A-disaccharide synthase
MHIALVAGDLSGDFLGGRLIIALKERYPQARFSGIGGPSMIMEGLQTFAPLEKLAVMGFVEVLCHIPELFNIRRQLYRHLLTDPPQVFIGIDAPDFNLGLEERLRARGIHTVHYAGPSVWAWRPWRVGKVSRAVDLVLVLFPFEVAFYQNHRIPVCHVGHPLADLIPFYSDVQAARRLFSAVCSIKNDDNKVIALLPGSRMSEVNRMGRIFLETAQWLSDQRTGLRFVMPAATPQLHAVLTELQAKLVPRLPLTVLQGQAREVMAAADVVLLASGTATLEAMLLKRPMVVAYQVAPVTAFLAKRLVSITNFSLPNLLSGKDLVPEFFQGKVRVIELGRALLYWLDDIDARRSLTEEFKALHTQLRCDASQNAVEAISPFLEV